MSNEEKYGVPVAARVRPEVAEHLKMMALKRNKSLAKCLAEVIETAPLLGGEEYAGTRFGTNQDIEQAFAEYSEKWKRALAEGMLDKGFTWQQAKEVIEYANSRCHE